MSKPSEAVLESAQSEPETSLHTLLQVLEDFQFGRPQFYAALLLCAFFAQGFWLVSRPLSAAELSDLSAGMSYWRHGPYAWGERSAGSGREKLDPSLLLASAFPALFYGTHAEPHSDWRWLARLPFLALGLWLGAGLWWVARRLYGNAGGYIALALYCFSLPVLRAAGGVSAEIITTWGLFGGVFTAIGVAHTLYAPPARWWPRVLVLSLAIGFSVAAQPPSIIALPLELIFLLYLAPGRRLVSAGIMAAASSAAALISWIAAGFTYVPFIFGLRFFADPVAHAPDLRGFRESFLASATSAQTLLLAIALATYIVWRRARYFGNTAPLVAGLVFILYLGYPGLWALPLLYVFAGGIFADLLESRARRPFLAIASILLASNACLALVSLGRSLRY